MATSLDNMQIHGNRTMKRKKELFDEAVRDKKTLKRSRCRLDNLEDGYKWQKYGQKTLMDSDCTRSYYRCNHKVSSCPAKKSLDRSQIDQSLLRVIYSSEHNHPKPNPAITYPHLDSPEDTLVQTTSHSASPMPRTTPNKLRDQKSNEAEIKPVNSSELEGINPMKPTILDSDNELNDLVTLFSSQLGETHSENEVGGANWKLFDCVDNFVLNDLGLDPTYSGSNLNDSGLTLVDHSCFQTYSPDEGFVNPFSFLGGRSTVNIFDYIIDSKTS